MKIIKSILLITLLLIINSCGNDDNISTIEPTEEVEQFICPEIDVEMHSLEDVHRYIMNYKNGRSNMHRLIKYIRDRREHRERWVGAIQKAEIPIRLIDGPLDPVSGGHLVEYYNKMIPSPDTVVIEGAGHWPQTENPEEVLRCYLEFREGESK